MIILIGKDLKKHQKELQAGKNPRDLKAKLAYELVKLYHGEKEAKKAADNFEKTFVKREIPDDLEEVLILDKNWHVVDLLHFTQLVSSKSEARRLIDQGGVKVDGAIIGDREATIRPQDEMVIQIGKRKFIRIKLDK